MIEAVIFDFDGVIVDSERLHWAAFNAVLEPRGKMISWPDYVETYIGFDDRDTFKTCFPNIGKEELAGFIETKAAAFQELLNEGGAAALPGVVDLIKHLSGAIPIAICSGALKEDIFPILGKLGIDGAFNVIVTADDTHISKPDPAPYRLAKERLDVKTAIAIEDTPAGITSARGAELNVLAVTNSYPPEFLSEADVITDSLEGLTLEKLNELF